MGERLGTVGRGVYGEYTRRRETEKGRPTCPPIPLRSRSRSWAEIGRTADKHTAESPSSGTGRGTGRRSERERKSSSRSLDLISASRVSLPAFLLLFSVNLLPGKSSDLYRQCPPGEVRITLVGLPGWIRMTSVFLPALSPLGDRRWRRCRGGTG